MFKITDGYKLELQTPWSYLAPQKKKKKKKNRQRKNRTNIMILKVNEVVLAHLADNQYQ